MNNEIKEIIDLVNKYWKDYYTDDYISGEEVKKLVDYITNLQKENEILKENAEHNDKVVDKAKWNEMIYKSRIEKAKTEISKLLNRYLFEKAFYIEDFHLDKVLKILDGWSDDHEK